MGESSLSSGSNPGFDLQKRPNAVSWQAFANSDSSIHGPIETGWMPH